MNAKSATDPKSPTFNKQLYENSELSKLFSEEKAVRRATGIPNPLSELFNSKDPNLVILHEKPEHRLLLWMKAQGASNKEISEQSGYTYPWLSQLFRQPWAQQRLIEMMDQCGRNRVSTMIASAAEDSVMTLIELRDDEDTPAVVRKSSAEYLINRFLGTPTQQVEIKTEPKDGLTTVEDLNSRISALEAEESKLLGKS